VLLLQASNVASGVSNAAVMVTIPWLVLEVTDSSSAAGLVVAIAAVPGLVAAPLAGWLVDQFGRRRVSVVADLFSAMSVAGFPLAASMTELGLGILIALSVLGAMFDPAGNTARRAAIPGVAAAAGIEPERLNGVHEGCSAAGFTLGPLLGTALIATVGATASFWLPFGLFVFAALCMALLGGAAEVADSVAGRSTATAGWRGLFAGVAVLRADRLLRSITVSIVILAAIYLPTETVLLPTHFEELGQPGALGVVVAFLAGGATIGSFAYGWLRRRLSKRRIFVIAMLGTSLAIWPMALLLPVVPMAIASAVIGLAWGPYNPLMNTLVQERVPADQQGRVYGVQAALFSSAPPIAILVVGLVVDWLGVRTTYLVLAGLLSAWTVVILRDPAIAEIDRPMDPAAPVSDAARR
jgi:MFS family permease